MNLYEQCYKVFRADEHEWNGKGFIYVNVNATIQRLNELVELEDVHTAAQRLGINYNGTWSPAHQRLMVPINWSLESKHFSLTESIQGATKNGKAQYDAVSVVELSLGYDNNRMGTGADTNADPDTASKSAQAYALRKAANQFGVGMYLLRNPKEEEKLIKFLHKDHENADQDDADAMKRAVLMHMDLKNIEVSAANLVSSFGVSEDELRDDPEVWLRILRKENRV